MSGAVPGEVLVTRERLTERVREMAAEISADYAGRDLLVIGILKGAVFFTADLVRELTVPCEIDFMSVSSYGSATHSSGVVRITKDLDVAIEGRDVLLVEDVIDSGRTLRYLMRNLSARDPASLETCALLSKPAADRLDLGTRYVGFRLPDVFVVGYGLDAGERFRELPYISALPR
ncbi:MAG: hypoxanthine phosphoribosyltransferase [Miltoncostaeaceae bacterium]